MKLRPRTLPAGWYPSSAIETKTVIEDFLRSRPAKGENAVSCVVPHAGWGYSGCVACETINHLDKQCDTVVIVGGHLPGVDTLLASFEEGYATPLEPVQADLELLAELRKELDIKEDRYADNTVEIQLPFVRYMFPAAKVLGMRVSPTACAIDLGKNIARISNTIGKKVCIIGSTDFTHYGPNYGFIPRGIGSKAVEWVRDVNDKKIVDAFLACDCESALIHARSDNSACSAGGAVCAASFAYERGIRTGELVRYMTSWDISAGDSFVGYAGIIYS
jgi:AmmeMemoRadiSam system protein B